MKWAACMMGLIVCSCAHTEIRFYDNGRLTGCAFIQGDAKNITVKTDHGYFHADELNNSQATIAGSKTVAATTSYLGGLATILRIILPFLP